MRIEMPITGLGTAGDAARPKYECKRLNEHYYFDGNGKPVKVELTTTEDEGEKLLMNADVKKIGDVDYEEELKYVRAKQEEAVRNMFKRVMGIMLDNKEESRRVLKEILEG